MQVHPKKEGQPGGHRCPAALHLPLQRLRAIQVGIQLSLGEVDYEDERSLLWGQPGNPAQPRLLP